MVKKAKSAAEKAVKAVLDSVKDTETETIKKETSVPVKEPSGKKSSIPVKKPARKKVPKKKPIITVPGAVMSKKSLFTPKTMGKDLLLERKYTDEQIVEKVLEVFPDSGYRKDFVTITRINLNQGLYKGIDLEKSILRLVEFNGKVITMNEKKAIRQAEKEEKQKEREEKKKIRQVKLKEQQEKREKRKKLFEEAGSNKYTEPKKKPVAKKPPTKPVKKKSTKKVNRKPAAKKKSVVKKTSKKSVVKTIKRAVN